MAPPRLTLYLDIVSPFAYMAFYILENSPVFRTCDITYIPIFLGGVMKATGNTPPIRIKNKGEWVESERRRWSKRFSIPILDKAPEGFPPNTITAQRALCAIQLSQPTKLTAAFKALYHAFWVEGKPIQNAETISAAVATVLSGAEAKEVLGMVAQPEAKNLLTSNTDAALKSGAFGLPWFVATNAVGKTEGFWGVDHLGQVAEFLGLDRAGAEKGFQSML